MSNLKYIINKVLLYIYFINLNYFYYALKILLKYHFISIYFIYTPNFIPNV